MLGTLGVGNDRTLAFAALALLAGCGTPDLAGDSATPGECTGEASTAIQGGGFDARDSSVVGVALVDAEGDFRRTCTGTLIAPNLVLTAQHCVADTAHFVNCARSRFGPVVAASKIRVTTSASMWSDDAEWFEANDVIAPPGGDSVCGRDVALIVLSTCVDAKIALPLAPDLETDVARQQMYAAVGYGVSSRGAGDAGLRRRRDRLHVVCVGAACGSGQIEDGEWRGDHGICSGDSGGPAIDGEGRVIGVTSRGPAGCESPIYGSLASHAEWMRDSARHAASGGAYAKPAWIGDGVTEPPHPPKEPIASGGCRAARTSRGDGAAWLVVPALALAVRRRRSGILALLSWVRVATSRLSPSRRR